MEENMMRKGEKLIRNITVVLLFLLLLYYISTFLNMHSISKQVDMIGAHPFPVSQAAGKVDACMERLRAQVEKLLYDNQEKLVAAVESEYAAIHVEMKDNLKFIQERYLTDPQQAVVLAEYYEKLHENQSQLIALCRDSATTDSEIEKYADEYIFPRIAEMESTTATILRQTQGRFDEFSGQAHTVYRESIILSTLLAAAVIVTLIFYKRALNQKTQYEKEIRSHLRDALDSAQYANEAKSRFLSNMSHDIRTPLNAIIGMTSIAQMDSSDTKRVEDCLAKITTASRQLLGLINDVLDMSKIESGRVMFEREEIHLPTFIQDFITVISTQAKAGKLDLDVVVQNIQNENVVSDGLRLNQILMNLAGNAIKFTPEGGSVRLIISQEESHMEGEGRFCFIVEDTGIGMSPEFAAKIFQPFEREKNSTISQVEGTGLGMAITKNIVDMMNGTIAVESETGKGSRFIVKVPLEICQDAYMTDALDPMRILVVDDDPDVCINTTGVLNQMGMDTSWILNGEEAVENVVDAHQKEEDFQAVIMDWKLPGIDGVEASRRIKSILGREIPIIMITAYDWTEIETEAREAGIKIFLSKPLFRSRLYQAIKEVVNGEVQEPSQVPEKAALPELKGRALVVEDNAVNMMIAEEIISKTGIICEQASDGIQALEMVCRAPEDYYQIIFMDIQMPKMNGYDTTREIRRFEKESGLSAVPIVAMTANAFSEDRQKAEEAGMNGYITKPINVSEVIRNLIKFQRLE